MTVLRYMTDYMMDPHRHAGRRDSLALYASLTTMLNVAIRQRGGRTCRTDSRCPTGQGVGQDIGQSGQVLGHDARQVI